MAIEIHTLEYVEFRDVFNSLSGPLIDILCHSLSGELMRKGIVAKDGLYYDKDTIVECLILVCYRELDELKAYNKEVINFAGRLKNNSIIPKHIQTVKWN